MNRLKDINIFSFQVFVLVYESLNSLSVAQTLNVPASKISRCLNSLRQALDDPLFYRKQYGFEPSDMATRIYPEMKKILELADQACTIDMNDNDRFKQVLTIACPMGLSIKLSRTLQQHAERHGQHFTFIVKPIHQDIDNEIRHGSLDAAICFDSSSSEGVKSEFLARGSGLFVVGSNTHPLWKRSTRPQLKEIIDYPLITADGTALKERIDPLEVYASDINRNLELGLKVSGLSDLADQLDRSPCLALVGQQHAVDFLNRISDLKVRRLPQEQFYLLHQRMGVPSYFLLSPERRRDLPEWLLPAISEFVTNAVTLADAGEEE